MYLSFYQSITKNNTTFKRKYFMKLFFNFCFNLILVSTLISCNSTNQKSTKSAFDYVNPFIGTGGHGHTYPGATLPFGMVQLT